MTHTSTSVQSYNTLVGKVSYHITNQAFYQYAINIQPSTSIAITTNVTVDYLQYDYLLLTFAKCPVATSWLAIS